MRSSRPQKEIWFVFCDVSKAFDRVRYGGLLHELERIGLTGKLLLCFGSYLTNRRQWVTTGSATSHTAGVPQGSVLGPLLFLIFINDIVENIGYDICLVGNDATLFIDFHDEATGTNMINSDLIDIKRWADNWLVSLCSQQTESTLLQLKKPGTHHFPYISETPWYMKWTAINTWETHWAKTCHGEITSKIFLWKLENALISRSSLCTD